MIHVAIYGAGGHGREIWALLRALDGGSGAFDFVGWVDDAPPGAVRVPAAGPVFASLEGLLAEHPTAEVALAVAHPAARQRLAGLLDARGVHSPKLRHPWTWVGVDVALGAGTQIGAGAILSTGIRIGNHVIINQGVTIAHDVVLDDFVTVAPGARLSGAVRVERGADVGTGAAIIQGVRIGAWSIVGAGAVVVRDVPPNTTVVGVPARVIRARAEGWQLERNGR